MDFQPFVDSVAMPCCVLSVEKTREGTCGEIRIIAANQPYRDTMGPAYYDGMVYSELVPQDNKFEDYCFRSAILKQRMHAYVETKALHCWTDQTLIPLASDREDMGYCQFIFEYTRQAEADRMSSVSINTAGTVISACIKLISAEDFSTSVGDTLDVILEKTGAKAARIMLMDHRSETAVVYCERMTDQIWSTQREQDEVITYDLIQTWEAMIGVSNGVIVKDEQDMKALEEKNPAWAKSMREHSVTSLALVPLRRGKDVVGYLYVVNFDVSKVVEVKELIELMSFFLGSEIYNHRLLEELEQLSQIDALTGLNNRRAMIQRMKTISESKCCAPYGVINIDLNGLKEVNDKKGHDEGDRLLAQAGEVLKKIFHQEDLFRTGGDEFVIITTDIDRETFEKKILRLRRDAEKNGISLAVGGYWSDGTVELTPAMRYADENMYTDKQAFYRTHPHYRKRIED